MPINIYNKDNTDKVAWLSDDCWVLPTQIDNLEVWLKENEFKVYPGNYIADIVFDIRKDACGGEGVLTTQSMDIMVKFGIELYLSEYPDDES